ncbi:hypothetical protein Tco_1349985, partial [Tanacetum coccineum]
SSILSTPGNVLGIKPKGKLRIPICLGDVRGTSGSDAFYVVSPVVGVRNPMLCLQRRLVVGVDLGQMLLDALLDFWTKDPRLPLRLDLVPRRVVHRELPEDLPEEVTPMRRVVTKRHERIESAGFPASHVGFSSALVYKIKNSYLGNHRLSEVEGD